MQRSEQIALLKRLLHYLDTKTTAMAEAPHRHPVSTYTCPDRLQREQSILFRHRPLLMGFASEWPNPGDYKTDDLSGAPILIVRGDDGLLRAFLNVCRHRGAKVAGGCGSARAFSCAYHAWSYDLAGHVKRIPVERCFPGVRAERPALTPLPLCEKHGLVWVIPSPASDGATTFDIDPWLAGLAPELAAYDFAPWAHYRTLVIRRDMNWKLAVDTFHEGYHIGVLHRKTIAPLFADAIDFKSFGPNLRMTLPRSKITRLKARPESECHWEANVDLTLRTVDQEDFPIGEAIQAGFASGAQTHTVFGTNEPAMIHYHQSLARELGVQDRTVSGSRLH